MLISAWHLDRNSINQHLQFPCRRISEHESLLDKVHLRIQRQKSSSKEKRAGGGETKKEEGTCKFCSLSFPLDQMKQHYLGHIQQKCKLASDEAQKSEASPGLLPFTSVLPPGAQVLAPSAQEVHAPPSPPQTPPRCDIPSVATDTLSDIKPFLRMDVAVNPMSIPSPLVTPPIVTPPIVSPPTTFVPPLFLSTHCEDKFDAYEDSCPTSCPPVQLPPSKQKVGRGIVLARSLI